jgi:hypothetical protein
VVEFLQINGRKIAGCLEGIYTILRVLFREGARIARHHNYEKRGKNGKKKISANGDWKSFG